MICAPSALSDADDDGISGKSMDDSAPDGQGCAASRSLEMRPEMPSVGGNKISPALLIENVSVGESIKVTVSKKENSRLLEVFMVDRSETSQGSGSENANRVR